MHARLFSTLAAELLLSLSPGLEPIDSQNKSDVLSLTSECGKKLIPWEQHFPRTCCSYLCTTEVYYRTAYYESAMINMLCKSHKPSRRTLLLNYVRWHFEGSSSEFAKGSVSITIEPRQHKMAIMSLSGRYQPLWHSLGASTYTWGWTSVFSLHSVLCYSFFQDCVFLGAGGPSLTEYQSVIFYHNSSPKWNETIKVQFFAVNLW